MELPLSIKTIAQNIILEIESHGDLDRIECMADRLQHLLERVKDGSTTTYGSSRRKTLSDDDRGSS